MSTSTFPNILARISGIHDMSPNDAIVLSTEAAAALREAVRNAGGGILAGDLVAPPTFTGRAIRPSWGDSKSEPATFVELVDAPILGKWAGATLIREADAEAHDRSKWPTRDNAPLLETVRGPGGLRASLSFGDQTVIFLLPDGADVAHDVHRTAFVLTHSGRRHEVSACLPLERIAVAMHEFFRSATEAAAREPSGLAALVAAIAKHKAHSEAAKQAADASAEAVRAAQEAVAATGKATQAAVEQVKSARDPADVVDEHLAAAAEHIGTGGGPAYAAGRVLAAAVVAERAALTGKATTAVFSGEPTRPIYLDPAAGWRATADRLVALADALGRVK